MSPVSRGRRVKKTSASSGGRATGRATVLDRPRSALSALMAQLCSPSEPAEWFDPAIAAVLGQAHVVLEVQHPRALERLTSQLIGTQLHQVLTAEKTGLWFDRWFIELVSATESRVREQTNGGAWEAPFACCTAWPRSAPPARRRRRLRPPTDCAS